MKIEHTPIPDLLIISPTVYEDDRGYFVETFHQERMVQHGLNYTWVQDNEAKSTKGALRGLHYQSGVFAQAKLVRVTTGSVYDVVVDLRRSSKTYGEWFGLVLSETNKKQLLVPRGFAHGYLVLEDDSIFNYKCDNLYHKKAEGGLKYNDPKLNIEWPNLDVPFIISERDQKLPYFGEHLIAD